MTASHQVDIVEAKRESTDSIKEARRRQRLPAFAVAVIRRRKCEGQVFPTVKRESDETPSGVKTAGPVIHWEEQSQPI